VPPEYYSPAAPPSAITALARGSSVEDRVPPPHDFHAVPTLESCVVGCLSTAILANVKFRRDDVSGGRKTARIPIISRCTTSPLKGPGPSGERRWQPPSGRGNLQNHYEEIPGGTTMGISRQYDEIIISLSHDEPRLCRNTIFTIKIGS